MLFLASLRRAYKLSYTTYRPTKAFGYIIDSRVQPRPYGSKSTGNSKFCKGKKSGKKTKRHVERSKRGSGGKKKLSRKASAISPVALISDGETRPTVALIPINLFEENQSDHDAFRDALAILAVLKKKSRQVELFMESYNNLREGSAIEKIMGESPYVTEGSELELDQLDKEILAESGKREKEQPTKDNEQERDRKPLDLNDVPVAGMQLNFELNMTNIRDAILYPENRKQIRDKPFSDEEGSRLVLSTNVHVDPDNKATIPLQMTALIHGTVHIDPTKFSKEKLGQLQVSQFNEYVTAVAATLCSKALQKGFPMNVSRNVYKSEPLRGFEQTKTGPHVNKGEGKGSTPQSTVEVVDVADLYGGPQEWARFASAVDSKQQESVDRTTEANKSMSRFDAGMLGQNADAVNKNVVIADSFVERAEREGSAGAANIGTEAVERNLTKERNAERAEGSLEPTGGTKEEAGREVNTSAESVEEAGRKVLPTDSSRATAETEEIKAETVEKPSPTVATDDAKRIEHSPRDESQATDTIERTKGEKEGNVESTGKNASEVAKTEITSKPTLEKRVDAQEVKANDGAEGESEERKTYSKEILLDAQARRANVRERTVSVEGTTLGPSDATEEKRAANRRNDGKEHGQERTVEASSPEGTEGSTAGEADEMKPQTNVSQEKTKSDANSTEIVSKTFHRLDSLPLEKNADVLGKMIDALELPESKTQSIPNEKIASSSVQGEMDKAEIARQIELSKGLTEDFELSKYSDESFEFSKSPNKPYEVFSDVDQVRNAERLEFDKTSKNVNPGLERKEMDSDEVKQLQRRYYQFKGELYDLTTFKGQPSSYAIGLGSAAAIPGKGKSGDNGTKQDSHIVCVRKGSKGCMSPGLAENAFYTAKKSLPSDAGSKTSEMSLRGLHQKSLDDASSRRQVDTICTRSSSTTSKSDSDKKKGSVCGSTPPCQNKTKKQQLPPVTKKPSAVKCGDPCKRTSSTPATVKSKSSCGSQSNDPCKRSPSEQSKSEDPCKRFICISKKKPSSCSSQKSDPCKTSSSEAKDPCKISKKFDPCKSSKKSDPCKKSSSESKDACKISKKSDPCKRSSSESKDPCKRSSSASKDPCKSSKKPDPCKRSSSEYKDPCKISKKPDPCKRSSSESKDPCKRSSSDSKDPCKRSSSESKDPCKISKKSDPCKRSSSESKDPCKRLSSESKDPCKVSKKSDPCKRSSSESKDPCKRSSSESKDPCKISKKSDPCKRSSSESKDPCKRSSSESKDACKISKKSDPCKRSSSESKDPCKRSSSASKDPCKASKKSDPCKKSSSKSNLMKVDPCKKSPSKSKEPCKGQQQSSGDVKNQEALILSPFKICKRTIPIKPVNENDVHVCIDSVALSDSDIHMFETGAKKYPGITLGNEAAGVVQKVGKKVKHLRAGDHVAIECGVPCGRCSLCRSGHYNLCQQLTFKGCLKKYCTHPASFCHKISKSVPLPSAALGYQLSLGCNACAQAGIKPNSNVAIIGSCAMTLCTAMCANAMGCSNVCVICTTPDTHDVVTKNITEKVECIDSQTTSKGIYQRICDSLCAHPDVVINCSCSTKTMNASIMALKPNGTCVVSGCLCECATYNMMDALMKEIRIIPSFRSKNMFPFAVHLLERRQIPIDCIVAECVAWKELEVGFKKALTENNCGPRKVIVQCHAGNEGGDGCRKS